MEKVPATYVTDTLANRIGLYTRDANIKNCTVMCMTDERLVSIECIELH